MSNPQTPASGTTKVEFAYDYMGRRVEKKVFNYVAGDWQLKTDNLFLYDGWNLISESTVTGQQSPSDKSYIWGLDLSQSLQGAGGVGGLIAAVDNGETYHYFYDGNGNVAQLIKASDGLIAAHYEYDPYGKVINASGPAANENPILFSTKFFDDETGFGYWGYRYYSPNLGRWINRDPSEEKNGKNLYDFTKNNPINYSDSLGLWTRTDGIPLYIIQLIESGDAIAAQRATWELWEAECGDTIDYLVRNNFKEVSNGEWPNMIADWPKWLSLYKAAPGRHSLPHIIQPGDIYKVKRWGAIIGKALPNADLWYKGRAKNQVVRTDTKGNYGFYNVKPNMTYIIKYMGYIAKETDKLLTPMPRSLDKRYKIFVDYGEVKILYLPGNVANRFLQH